jgi:hypothetical protein
MLRLCLKNPTAIPSLYVSKRPSQIVAIDTYHANSRTDSP